MNTIFNSNLEKNQTMLARGFARFWSKLRLARKLLVAFSGLAFLALLVGVVANLGLRRVQTSYRSALAGGQAMELTSLHMSADLLTARRHEKDFLARWTTEGFDIAYANYVVPNQQAAAEIHEHIDELAGLAPVVEQDKGAAARAQYESDLATLSESIDLYEQNFLATVQLLQEKGFQETGLEGKLRADVHNIEDRIYDREGLESLVITMLQIRRREKDYLLRGDQEYIDNVHQYVSDLKQQIAASDVLEPAEKKEMAALTDQYLVSFDTLAEKDVEIAASTQSFRDAAHIMEPLVDKIAKTGAEFSQLDVSRAQTNSTQTLLYSSITLIVALLVAVILSVALSRQITRPVIQLTGAAHELETGNYDAYTNVTTEDELGMLGSAFNTMTSRLKEAFALITKRATELQSVAEIATQASQATDAQDMLQTVVDLTKSNYHLYHSHIYLLNEAKTHLVLAAGAGEPGRQMVSEKRSIRLDHERSLVARAARTVEGAISNDVAREPDFLPNPLLPYTKSEMAIPIAIGDNVLGVLDVQADHMDRFTKEDIAIITTLAQQVAASLETLRQFQVSQKMARELGVVATVSTATATITETDRLLQEVVNKTKEAFSLYHAHIYLINETEDTLVLTAGAGEIGKQMVSEGRRIPLDSEKSLVARAARTRVGAAVNDVQADPDFLPHPLLPNTRSEQAVPMIVGDKVLGVLDVQSEHLNRFTEIDVNINTTLAAQVAVALQNARNFAQAQSQADRESMLNTIGQKIQSAMTVEAVLQIAARELGRALSAPLTIAQLGMSAKNKALANDNGNGH
jgi:GAF domain-containing protein/HAMP domain-containing protein